MRTNTLQLCCGMSKRLPLVLIWLARTSILHGHKHGFLPRNETNDHPFGPTRSNWVNTRPEAELMIYSSSAQYSIDCYGAFAEQRRAAPSTKYNIIRA